MKCVKIVGAVGLVVGLCLSSQATILLPGQVGLDAPQAPGSVILAEQAVPFTGSGGISGTVTSWVVRDPANPLGGLSFYYQVSNTGAQGFSSFTSSDFGIIPGSPVEVSTITAPFDGSVTGGVGPFTGSRSTGAGSTVRFIFLSADIQPGQSSVVMVVNTAYQLFQHSVGGIINSQTSNVDILGPAVPEPATFVAGSLLLLPLGISMLRIVRKNKSRLMSSHR